MQSISPSFALRKAATRWIGGLALLTALGACSQAAQQRAALEPNGDTACALDGMVLKDHAGPKAQIHFAEGSPEFFCDLKELFRVLLDPEQKRPPAAVFVQDMGKTDWQKPEGNWVDAKTAVYVVGSRKHGAMGPTFASFSAVPDAEAFVAREGGKVVRFEHMTVAMTDMGGGAAHDKNMH